MEGTTAPPFELPNVSVGPDPLSLSTVAELADFAVLMLLRDYHCPGCKRQVRDIAEYAEELSDRNVAVIGVLPESKERAATWERQFDLPFPLLADPEGDVGEKYDQPIRFGALGERVDLIGRMPETAVLDLRDDPIVVTDYEGDSAFDRPDPDEILDVVDEMRESFVFDCTLVEC